MGQINNIIEGWDLYIKGEVPEFTQARKEICLKCPFAVMGTYEKWMPEKKELKETQGYKDVAKFANKALLGMQAVNIRQHLRAVAIGKTFPSAVGGVGVTGGSVKKLLRNNYHSNSLLWDLKGLLKNAVLVKSAANTKAANTMVTRYHYLKVTAGDGKDYYLNIRELKTGELILYAITYGMK